MKRSIGSLIVAIALMFTASAFAQAPATQPATQPARGRGNRPPITYLPVNPSLPTLWIIGDSTVRNGSYEDGGNGQWGWGNPIRHYFDETKINIQNRAMGGTSSKSYQESATLWAVVLPMIKPGDYLIAQFGHNDSPTPKGNDDELHASARGGESHTFGWYMRKYVTDARERGAVEAIICSPIPRNRWADDKVPADGWVQTAKEAATQVGAKFMDLNALIIAKYEPLGREKVTELYFPEREAVHTDWAGAIVNAECVIDGLKQLNSPLVQYLKPVPPTDLKHPAGRAR